MDSSTGNKVPSIHQCYELLKRYNVPDNVIGHSEVVRRVAVFLTERLNKTGEKLDIAQIGAAALLHDIAKMEGIRTRQDHAKTGQRLLRELGYKRIGGIVAEHVRLREGRISRPLSEEEIINYSDKRVMHDHIVTLEERFADLRKRYGRKDSDGNTIERIIALEDKTYELESKIFSRLDFPPEELLHVMGTK